MRRPPSLRRASDGDDGSCVHRRCLHNRHFRPDFDVRTLHDDAIFHIGIPSLGGQAVRAEPPEVSDDVGNVDIFAKAGEGHLGAGDDAARIVEVAAQFVL
jgi:hypothetical protein